MNEKRETDGKREVGRIKYLFLVNKKNGLMAMKKRNQWKEGGWED